MMMLLTRADRHPGFIPPLHAAGESLRSIPRGLRGRIKCGHMQPSRVTKIIP